MRQQPSAPSAERALRAEASAWIAKLHGPDRSPELEADFRRWLQSSPQHARAFERITDVWESLGAVDVGGLPRVAAGKGPEEGRGWHRPLGWAAAACAVAAIAVLAVVSRSGGYATAVGEQRIVNLPDGSRLSLNAVTRVEVSYDDARRVIRLARGEIFCEVAKDAARPLVVFAGDRIVTALGTSFVVRHEREETSVTLVQGSVAVASANPEARPLPTKLEPGQRLILQRNQPQRLDTPPPESATAWRRGEVILDRTSLEDAVREMNRYDRAALVLDDAAVAKLPISGIYRTGNNQDFAGAVAVVYGLEVRREDGEIHLRIR